MIASIKLRWAMNSYVESIEDDKQEDLELSMREIDLILYVQL